MVRSSRRDPAKDRKVPSAHRAGSWCQSAQVGFAALITPQFPPPLSPSIFMSNSSVRVPSKDTHRFKQDFGSILNLLSEAIYSSETVFLRELAQNAVDAITARREIEPRYQGSIRFHLSQSQPSQPGRLLVEDDGIGLTEEEIHNFLSVIGASSKRSDLDRCRSGAFIGQFGIGLLSCFMISKKIILLTRSSRSGSPGLRWEGNKDGTYQVRAAKEALPIGTTVILEFSESTRERYDAEKILDLLKKHCRYLPFPITFQDGAGPSTPINPAPFPWDRSFPTTRHERLALAEFARHNLGDDVLDGFTIQSEGGGIRGMAFLMKDSVGALNSAQHTVYLKGMFLSRAVDGIAPRGMPFIRCVVNATDLKPNAAREGLQDSEDSLWEIRDAVAQGFRAWVLRKQEQAPFDLERVMRVHQRSFFRLAAEDAEFRKLIAPHLTFETTQGIRQLSELRGRKTSIHYIAEYEEYRRAEPFAMAHGILVLNAGYAGMADVLRHLAIEFPEERFTATSASALHEEFAPVARFSAERNRLLHLARETLAAFSCEANLIEDESTRDPATLHVPSLSRQLRALEDNPDLGFLNALQTEACERSDSRSRPVLEINVCHPVVQRLECDPEPDRIRMFVELFYQVALRSARIVPSMAESERFRICLSQLYNTLQRSGASDSMGDGHE